MMISYRLNILLFSFLLAGCGKTVVPSIVGETPDPLEPVNRRVWAANEVLLDHIVEPAGRGFRTVVPKPARQSIKNMGRNAAAPGRLISETLQGRWADMGSETLRFMTNSTVGIGGLFDPATNLGIAKPRANFNQTLRKWGAEPSTYLILPALGPSDNIALPAYFADRAMEPWWYLDDPYHRGRSGVTMARLADESAAISQLLKTEPDAYQSARLFSSYMSLPNQPDWAPCGPVHAPTFETLAAAGAMPEDKDFAENSREIRVKLPSTGHKLPFNLWLQPKPAPMVYIIPGLRNHRLSGQVLGQAEKLYKKGYSVVSITSSFHPEFIKKALQASLPGDAGSTTQDLIVVVRSIDELISQRFVNQVTERSLIGFSMGAFQTLRLAALEEESGLRFDHYLAINPPVDLLTAARSLDVFRTAPLDWPEDERRARIANTLHKQLFLARDPKRAATYKYSETESKFLVNLFFQTTLRSVIFESQLRENLGMLNTPLDRWDREPAYQEIDQISFLDYYQKFVTPYHLAQGKSRSEIERANSLRSMTSRLKRNSRVRVIHSENDFLLNESDKRWLESTFGARLTMFLHGGHLGILLSDPVQKEVLSSLRK